MVEWRVVNAADYGFPQRRRRVFIVAEHLGDRQPTWGSPLQWLYEEGVLARALKVWPSERCRRAIIEMPDLEFREHPSEITARFGWGNKVTPFQNAGVMWDRRIWTRKVEPNFDGKHQTLGEVLVPDDEVPESFFIPKSQIPQWEYLKGAKREARRAANGHEYFYTEGAISFPDPPRPAVTHDPHRRGWLHAIALQARHPARRAADSVALVPMELERLNGFEDDWTDTGMPDGRRAFMMGNALVVGLIDRVAASLEGGSSSAKGSNESPGCA